MKPPLSAGKVDLSVVSSDGNVVVFFADIERKAVGKFLCPSVGGDGKKREACQVSAVPISAQRTWVRSCFFAQTRHIHHGVMFEAAATFAASFKPSAHRDSVTIGKCLLKRG